MVCVGRPRASTCVCMMRFKPAPAGAGLNLIMQTQVDALGRPTQTIDGRGNATYTLYSDYLSDDSVTEVRIYTWDSHNDQPIGPTQVMRRYRGLGLTDSFTMSATPHRVGSLSYGPPDGGESVGSLVSLSRSSANNAAQIYATDQY